MAGNNKSNPNCVGENVSPQLSWTNPPAGTKSFALLMFDPEGRPPGGVSHWVAYGIPASVTGFAEGEVSQADRQICRRHRALMKLPHYFGPCTPPGPPHHYTFTLIATDLEPTALQARHDARRGDQGARRPRQGRDRPDRHLLQAVLMRSQTMHDGRSLTVSRVTLLSLQILVAVVALALWHVLTTVPVFGRIAAAAVLLLQSGRCRAARSSNGSRPA